MSVPVQRGPRPARRVAVVWRGDATAERAGIASNERLRPVVDALVGLDVGVELVVYRDEIAAAVLDRLLAVDGVLAWVDPIGRDGETRAEFDRVLRRASDRDVWLGAHPDVIEAIGTKEVLYRTRHVGWVDDVHLYRSADELREQFPVRLGRRPRVLKQNRGNGGIGVWKVERADDQPDRVPTLGSTVSVHQAHVRDLETETLSLGAFLDQCAPYFSDNGCLLDQPFHPRVCEGLIRAYLVADEVIGFAMQGAGDLAAAPGEAERIMGLPAPKTMFPPDDRAFGPLREQLETEWVPAMQKLLEVPTTALPALWDADFLLGPKTSTGEDTYVLCEINASCITPFPPEAPAKIAQTAVARITTTPTPRSF